jgi:hypothetical protein
MEHTGGAVMCVVCMMTEVWTSGVGVGGGGGDL